MYFLAIDTETGGLDPTEHSLLSLGLVLADQDFKPLEALYWDLKPNDGVYRVTAEAMSVNKIELANRPAQRYDDAGPEVTTYLHNWFFMFKEKVVPVGKNLGFDLGFIHHNLVPKLYWDKFVSRRGIEINSLIYTLQLTGKLPKRSYSLKQLCDHYNIKLKHAHHSLHDAGATLFCFQALIESLKVSNE